MTRTGHPQAGDAAGRALCRCREIGLLERCRGQAVTDSLHRERGHQRPGIRRVVRGHVGHRPRCGGDALPGVERREIGIDVDPRVAVQGTQHGPASAQRELSAIVDPRVPREAAAGAAFLVDARKIHPHHEGPGHLGLLRDIVVRHRRRAARRGPARQAGEHGRQRDPGAAGRSTLRLAQHIGDAACIGAVVIHARQTNIGLRRKQGAKRIGAVQRHVHHADRAADRGAHRQPAIDAARRMFDQGRRHQPAHRHAPGNHALGLAVTRGKGGDRPQLVGHRGFKRPAGIGIARTGNGIARREQCVAVPRRRILRGGHGRGIAVTPQQQRAVPVGRHGCLPARAIDQCRLARWRSLPGTGRG